MRDRLQNLKFFRAMRNIFFCLAAVCLLEAGFLLFNVIVSGQRFLIPAIILVVLAALTGYLSLYYHGRFRCRD